jgi:hypothetical protein
MSEVSSQMPNNGTRTSWSCGIFRRAVLAISACMLLLALYVGGFLVFAYASGAEKIPSQVESVFGVTYLPLGFYMGFGLPGSTTLIEASRWALQKGAESTTK